MSVQLRDNQLKATKALPNGIATVTSDSFVLGNGTKGDFTTPGEFLLTAPALTVAQLANASTMRYDLVCSVNADLSTPTVLVTGAITQTGAGGVGAAAATYRFRPASNVSTYFGFKATNSAAADASAASATLEWLE
jgi:hypothetical protein